MNSEITIDFTGEFFVPGKSGKRIEADHMERYLFACKFARGKSLLDIACGVGYSAPLFMRAGACSYDGVDVNEKQIMYARRAYSSDHAHFFVGDITTFNNGKMYDLITCYETIEHVEKYELALKNLHNLLNPGGVLLISSPNRLITSPFARCFHDKPQNKFHKQEFTPQELMLSLRMSGFKVQNSDLYGQRQRNMITNKIISRCCSNKVLNKLSQNMIRDIDTKTSPSVSRVLNKIPRYFIFVATR